MQQTAHGLRKDRGESFLRGTGLSRIAHKAVENAARLLGVHKVLVDGTRVRHALRDAGFRNLVERDTVVVILIKAEDIRKVPGDCFAFAVGVGREIHGIGLFCRFLQFGNKLLLSLDDGIFWLEIVFHIHRTGAPSAVAHMAHGKR